CLGNDEYGFHAAAIRAGAGAVGRSRAPLLGGADSGGLLVGCSSSRGCRAGCGGVWGVGVSVTKSLLGRSRRIVVPFFTLLTTLRSPPCKFAIFRQIARPSPNPRVPSPVFFVVK